MQDNKKMAFTLAEVLITLGIIGVVAAMTLPSLIQSKAEKQTVVRLKKTYSTLENAYRLAKNDNGDAPDWFEGTDTPTNSKIFADKMKPYLKVMKECGFGTGCLPKGKVKHLDKTDYVEYDNYANEYRMILNDGTAIMFYFRHPECKNDEYCGNIKVYTGSSKGEYRWGVDFFIFTITPNRIIPAGIDGDTISFANFCNTSDHRWENGIGCAAWVVFNENMDYLHCTDLSWDGKHKCK